MVVVVVVVYRFYSSSYISTRRIVTAAGGGGEGADPPIKSALSRLFLPWHALLFFSGNLWVAGERVASFWQQGAARLRGRAGLGQDHGIYLQEITPTPNHALIPHIRLLALLSPAVGRGDVTICPTSAPRKKNSHGTAFVADSPSNRKATLGALGCFHSQSSSILAHNVLV